MELGLSVILNDDTSLRSHMLGFLDVSAGYRLYVAGKYDSKYCNADHGNRSPAASLWTSILQVTVVDRVVEEQSTLWPMRTFESVTQDGWHEERPQAAKTEFLQIATSTNKSCLHNDYLVEWLYTNLPKHIRERILREEYGSQHKMILYELQQNERVQRLTRFLETMYNA
jgi:hypothetical protein